VVVRTGCAGVEGRGCVSLLLGQRHRETRTFHCKKGNIGLGARASLECPGLFSFAEMKGGLGQKGEKGGPTYYEQKRKWLRSMDTPESAGTSGFRPTYFQEAKLFIDRSPFPHDAAAGNGQRGRLVNSREPREDRLVGLRG
jgi:hypothetical protein